MEGFALNGDPLGIGGPEARAASALAAMEFCNAEHGFEFAHGGFRMTYFHRGHSRGILLDGSGCRGAYHGTAVVFCPMQGWWQDLSDSTMLEVADWVVSEEGGNLVALVSGGAKLLFLIPGADASPDTSAVNEWLCGYSRSIRLDLYIYR